MPIKVTCGRCNKTFVAKAEVAGKRVLCPGCKQLFTVPANTDEDQPAPEESNLQSQQSGRLWPLATAALAVVLALAWSFFASYRSSTIRNELQSAVEAGELKAEQSHNDLENAQREARASKQTIDTIAAQLKAVNRKVEELQQTAAKQSQEIQDAQKKMRDAEAQIEALKKTIADKEAQEKQALKHVETDSLEVETKNFQGVWQVKGVVIDGKSYASHKQDHIIISGDRITREWFGIPNDAFTPYPLVIHIDPKQKPRMFDVTVPGEKKPAALGIYAWEGDLLRLHWGKERPKDFVKEPFLEPGSRIPRLNVILEKVRSRPLPPFPKTTGKDLVSTSWKVVSHPYSDRPSPVSSITFEDNKSGRIVASAFKNGEYQEVRTPFSLEETENGLQMLVPDLDPLKSKIWTVVTSRDQANLRLFDGYIKVTIWFARSKN